MNTDLSKCPSWASLASAKAAWNAIRSSNAPEREKQRCLDAYKRAARTCMSEAGLI